MNIKIGLPGALQAFGQTDPRKQLGSSSDTACNAFPCWTSALIKSLRKHAYSNILQILSPKNENFQIKNSDIFHVSAQNIDCGYSLEPPRRGGSNEYPQSMFLSRNKKNNVYPRKPQFYYIKVGFKGVKIIWACFRDVKWGYPTSWLEIGV